MLLCYIDDLAIQHKPASLFLTRQWARSNKGPPCHLFWPAVQALLSMDKGGGSVAMHVRNQGA